MRGERRHKSEKIAESRWKRFHLKQWEQFIAAGFGQYTIPVVGFYKKKKGCECRHCSSMKKELRRTRNISQRREAKDILT